MEQKPSVGRVVHYVSYGSPGGEFPARACRAAMITEVDDVTDEDSCCFEKNPVGLVVFNPSGQWFNRHVHYDENKAPGTYHWPERV